MPLDMPLHYHIFRNIYNKNQRNTASFVGSYTNYHTWNVCPLQHFENIQDEILQDLSTHTLHNRKPEATRNYAAYSKVFDELTISDGGLIMRGERVVLPTSLIDSAVERAHQGHPRESNLKCRI